jgi:hypothetical protein
MDARKEPATQCDEILFVGGCSLKHVEGWGLSAKTRPGELFVGPIGELKPKHLVVDSASCGICSEVAFLLEALMCLPVFCLIQFKDSTLPKNYFNFTPFRRIMSVLRHNDLFLFLDRLSSVEGS